MDPRSLLALILKIIGIFFIRNLLEAVSRFLSVLIYLPQYETQKEAYLNLGVTVPAIILYLIFIWMLLFRTNNLVDMLKLDRNLPNIDGLLRIDRTTVFSAAVVIIGGWMLVSELPEFFRQAVYYFQERKLYVRMVRPDISYIAMSFIRVLIALMLIVFNRSVVRFLDNAASGRLSPRKR